MKISLVVCLLVVSLGFDAAAQVVIEGKVIDAKTTQPIPFLGIGLKNVPSGTLTNENGEFVLKVASLPVVIITSHLAYQTLEIKITNALNNTIKLTEATHTLAEVRVTNLAEKLLKQAYEKSYENRKKLVYGNAFYRQTTQTGNEYTELQEIFYAVELSNLATERLKMKQVRYAKLKSTPEKPGFTFINFTYIAWALNMKAQKKEPAPNRLIIPCRANAADYFDLTINDVVTNQYQEIYEIECTPKATNPRDATYFSGRVFINRKTSNILKIEGTLPSNIVSGEKVQGSRIALDYRFRELPEGFSVLDYGQVVFEGKLTIGNNEKIWSKATLVLYETGDNLKEKQLKKLDVDKKDLTEILKLTYDPAFWKNNPIIKRTAVEEQVIRSFEGKDAFGTALE